MHLEGRHYGAKLLQAEFARVRLEGFSLDAAARGAHKASSAKPLTVDVQREEVRHCNAKLPEAADQCRVAATELREDDYRMMSSPTKPSIAMRNSPRPNSRKDAQLGAAPRGACTEARLRARSSAAF